MTVPRAALDQAGTRSTRGHGRIPRGSRPGGGWYGTGLFLTRLQRRPGDDRADGRRSEKRP